jgi:hypothetical protein
MTGVTLTNGPRRLSGKFNASVQASAAIADSSRNSAHRRAVAPACRSISAPMPPRGAAGAACAPCTGASMS